MKNPKMFASQKKGSSPVKKGGDMFTQGRNESILKIKKPSGYGGLKNDTYLRPQPK